MNETSHNKIQQKKTMKFIFFGLYRLFSKIYFQYENYDMIIVIVFFEYLIILK